MPIYVYSCNNCGHELQARQKISDPQPQVCPNCQKENSLKKILTPSSFKLEGGGWFSQGYATSRTDKGN
jgi:putative FmdB family regulatory protein